MFLFELIKSLNKSEKRYFKLFTSLNGEKQNYVCLFDQLDSMEKFDSKALETQFESTNLPELKYYLTKILLKSLNIYHSDETINFQIAEKLNSVNILYEKGLIIHCDKILSKAYKLAKENEQFLWILKILRWKDKIKIHENISLKNYNTFLKQIQKESAYTSELLSEYEKLFYVYREINFYARSVKYVRTTEAKKKLKNLLTTIKIVPIKSNVSKYLAFKINAMICFIKGDFDGFQKTLLDSLVFMEQNKEYNSKYFLIHIDLCTAFLDAKKYKEAEEYLLKLQRLYKKFSHQLTTKDRVTLYMHISTIKLEIKALVKGNFQNGKILLENQIINDIEQNKKFIYNQDILTIYYLYALVYFGCKDYHESLFWLEKVLERREDIVEDIQGVARILILIIHFELGNIVLLESMILSTNRFLSKNKRLLMYEKVILQFMKKISTIKSNHVSATDFKILRKKLEDIYLDPFGKELLNMFDILAWVDSKIANCDYATIIQNKYNRENLIEK